MTQAPEAPPEANAPAAEAVSDAPVSGGFQVFDATTAYERMDFPAEHETETAPAEAAPSEPAPEAAKPAAAEPAAEATPADDDVPDDEIERILRHPKGQARLDQLVNNKLGNRLQQERAEQAAKDEAWNTATDYYTKLENDDDFYESEVAKVGEAKVLRFRADYQDFKTQREAKPVAEPANVEAVRAEFATAFNTAAVDEFKTIVKATLPYFAELPAEIRAKVDGAAYDPNGNWLADALTAIGEGTQKHIDSLKRSHAAALREATTAGANDAAAARVEAAPVVVDGNPTSDPREIERRYAAGDPTVTRDMFQKALKAMGKEW